MNENIDNTKKEEATLYNLYKTLKILTSISKIGNSYNASFKIFIISFSFIASTFIGITGTSYVSLKFLDKFWIFGC